VQILDEDRVNVLAGYEADACVRLDRGSLREQVAWRENERLPSGQPFVIELQAGKGVRFYAAYVTAAD
jgi:hypothetical protein